MAVVRCKPIGPTGCATVHIHSRFMRSWREQNSLKMVSYENYKKDHNFLFKYQAANRFKLELQLYSMAIKKLIFLN